MYNSVEFLAKAAFMQARKGRRPMRVSKIVEKENAGTGWKTKNKRIKCAEVYIPELQRRYGDAAADVFLFVEDVIKEASIYPGIALDELEWVNAEEFIDLCKEASADPFKLMEMSEKYEINPWASLSTLLPQEKTAASFPGAGMLSKGVNALKNIGKGKTPTIKADTLTNKGMTTQQRSAALKKGMTPERRQALMQRRAKLQQNIKNNPMQQQKPTYQGKQHSQQSQVVGGQNRQQRLQAARKQQQSAQAQNHQSKYTNQKTVQRTQQNLQQSRQAQQGAGNQSKGFGDLNQKATQRAQQAPAAPTAPATPKAPKAPAEKTTWQKAKPWLAAGGVTAGLGYGATQMMGNAQQGYSNPMGYSPQGY